jgi:hypothetical protein
MTKAGKDIGILEADEDQESKLGEPKGADEVEEKGFRRQGAIMTRLSIGVWGLRGKERFMTFCRVASCLGSRVCPPNVPTPHERMYIGHAPSSAPPDAVGFV